MRRWDRLESVLRATMINSDGKLELAAALRRRGIADARVLDAIASVPREIFVDPAYAEAAYDDMALPIACGQSISQPFVVAYMTDKLGLEPHHDVLEIGTGSGYQAAVLARLCRQVCTIERHEALHLQAVARFTSLDIRNITARVGDGWAGWPEPLQFDRIIVTAAARETPQALVDQLKLGGRMIIPMGARPAQQRLFQLDKAAEGLRKQDLLAVRFVPMVRARDS